MLRTIYFYGNLAEKYGKSFKFDVISVGEAFRAMECNFPGFRNDIRRDEEYYVVNGDDLIEENAMSNDTVMMEYKTGDFHICPVVGGDKSMWGNIATMVLGVILMVASYWVPPAGALGYGLITSAVVFNVGLALFATGIMGIISPPPRIGDYGIQEKPEERPSFIFDGPVNTINQGGPVPLVYGHVIVGSTLVSSSLEVTDTNV